MNPHEIGRLFDRPLSGNLESWPDRQHFPRPAGRQRTQQDTCSRSSWPSGLSLSLLSVYYEKAKLGRGDRVGPTLERTAIEPQCSETIAHGIARTIARHR